MSSYGLLAEGGGEVLVLGPWLIGGTTILACVLAFLWWRRSPKNIIDQDAILLPFLMSVPVECNALLQAARAAPDAPTDPILKDVVKLELLGKPTIITSNPQWVQHFMVTNTGNYQQRMGDPEGLADLGMLDTGVIWNNDTHNQACGWGTIRDIFKKSLDKATLQAAALVGIEEVHTVFDAALLSRSSSDADDALDLLRRVTLRITLVCFFDLHITTKNESGNLLPLNATSLSTPNGSSMTEDHIIKCVVDYFAAWNYFLLRPRRLRDAHEGKHLAAVQALQHVARTLWEAASTQSTRTVFIAGLMALKPPSEHHMIQNCLEMLLAGTDTSSVTMFYSLSALAQYPDMQEQLRAELIGSFASVVSAPLADAVISGESQRGIQAVAWRQVQHASSNSPLLEKILLETLRYKPVGPVSIRRAVNVDVLPDGTVFPAGGHVIVHLEAMHRTPELFPAPEKFDTTRTFANPDGKTHFAPFGKGTKGCPGQYLAMIEMKAVIAAFVLKYEIQQASNVSLGDMETHWDIANQPQNSKLLTFKTRHTPVIVTGASSSGKSTLVEALLSSHALRAGYVRIAEIARELMAQRGWPLATLENDDRVFEELQVAVLRGQLRQESTLRRAGTPYISDRGLDALAFIKQMGHRIADMKACEATMNEIAGPLAKIHQQALVLLVQPVEAFLKYDGTRLLDTFERSQEFNVILQEELRSLDVHPFVLPAACCNIDHRVQFVAQLLRELGSGIAPSASAQ